MGTVLIRLTLLWASILLYTVGAATQQTRASGAFDPAGATIPQLRAALDSGAISDMQLVRYYLDRIKRFDKSGPRINALINLNGDALKQARRIDAELSANGLDPDLLRLSVGTEPAAEIIAALAEALGTNASRSSFPAVVEKVGLVTVVTELDV